MVAERNGGAVWLEEVLLAAAENLVAGVTMTSFNGPEGGGTGVVNRPTPELMVDVKACLAHLRGQPTSGASLPDYRSRRCVVV